MARKQDILDAALTIFTEVGTWAGSTKSIALAANVSEALIFKHFKSKDNLTEHIVKSGYREATKLASEHLKYLSPENYISNLLDLPKILVYSDRKFWKMQYKILPLNAMALMHHQLFVKSSHELLVMAFTELGHEDAELEAEILLFIIEGLWKTIALNDFDVTKTDQIIKIAKKKYAVS